MKAVPLTAALALTLTTFASVADASPPIVRFDGGIGVHPVAGIATVDGQPVPVLNEVLGVPPGGRPWVIEDLTAVVRVDGRIDIRGEGLLLSGGDNIGTRGGVRFVGATLFCGEPGEREPFSAAGFPLDEAGDFIIRDILSPLPPPQCDNPVLLIRNAPPDADLGAWFAAGIPDLRPPLRGRAAPALE
jgi:hypothetical protein